MYGRRADTDTAPGIERKGGREQQAQIMGYIWRWVLSCWGISITKKQKKWGTYTRYWIDLPVVETSYIQLRTHSSSSMLIGVIAVPMVPATGVLGFWSAKHHKLQNDTPCQHVNIIHNAVVHILTLWLDMLQGVHISMVYIDECVCSEVNGLSLSCPPLVKSGI